MDYQETVNFLFEQLPMYQNKGKVAYKKDLNNTLALCSKLGNPEKKFKSIHVAGTNGKGSCSHFLASILQEAGYHVGLYTSPHLKDFRERIKINGKEISEEEVVQFVKEKNSIFTDIKPSFFEWTVALAFHHFAKKKVDIAVIETGLGGRLDSTNVLKPELSIITNIGLDHQDLLGNTLEQIAIEKAGIIKPRTPVVIGNPSGQIAVFKRIAKMNQSELVVSMLPFNSNYSSDLMGNYQKENIQTVITSVHVLRKLNWTIPESALKTGLSSVVKNTGLRGRWEKLGEDPLIIADTAHNSDGLKYTINQSIELNKEHIHFVLGFVKEKDLDIILSLFPPKASYYFSASKNARSLSAEDLQKLAQKKGLHGNTYPSISKALQAAQSNANQEDLIYIGGSTFVVSEVI